jgi:hypothetical protein
MAGKPALASVPVTQEPYRNRDCEDSRAHSFCHAKYTHVSQTLWRGLATTSMMPPGWVRHTAASKLALLALAPSLVRRVSRSPGAIELGFCSHDASGRRLLSSCFEKPSVMQDL